MPSIIIYSTPTCVYCRMAKAFLKEHNVPYQEKDVLADLDARKEMVEKSGQLGVPVIDVDGKIMVGFERNELARLAGIQ